MVRHSVYIVSFLTAIILAAWTNLNSVHSKVSCTWFLFDDNIVTNPGANGNGDGVAIFSEANDYHNYRLPKLWESVSGLCNGTDMLCAICAENLQWVNGKPKPLLDNSELIYTKLYEYFAYSEYDPDPEYLKEKNDYLIK